nr:MAG TPA: Integrase [Caudoviricetes sp.]
MNLQIYEKTRWENILRHKKNKNYVVRLNVNGVRTSVSFDSNGNKIFDIETAKQIRDNKVIIKNKQVSIHHKEYFDTLWGKYIDSCKIIKKQAYNTIIRKDKTYNRYLKNKIKVSISKTDKNFWSKYIDSLECSDKQKNQIIRTVKAFINWCIEEEFLLTNPLNKIEKYKVTKTEMKYWAPNEIKEFLSNINKLINDSKDIMFKKQALMVKTMVIIGFTQGDRIGETRALTFDCFDKERKNLKIHHSINYNRKEDPLASTKNYHSQRELLITAKLLEQIEVYKNFLKNYMNYNVKDNDFLFFNYATNKPYTDTTLRKQFKRFCDLCKVKKIRLYDLRHTFVALMMYEGKELYQIQQHLGHSSFSTTANEYGHLATEIKKGIAKSADKYL